MYYTYMLRCVDNTIYTGIAKNLEKRMSEHFSRNEKCAKYTMVHHAKKLEIALKSETRPLASKLEYHIKKLNKNDKEKLIKNPYSLDSILKNRISSENYEVVYENNIYIINLRNRGK